MPNGWHRKRDTPNQRQRTREYNTPQHRAARKAGVALVASGQACCWRCGHHIPPGTDWHVGHDDTRTIRGPEHARCNLRAAARAGAAKVNGVSTRSRIVW